ncbi:MAG TPA: primosomal protein N' [Nitrolancea sp.]|nr:primosomal protein N' [Nitrolancea sp.]
MDDLGDGLEDVESSTLFVDAAVEGGAGARNRLLTYALPPQLTSRIAERQLVWVPLRRKLVLAIAVQIHDQRPEFPVRPVYAPVEPEFRLSPRQWELGTWLSEQTICPLFDAAGPFLPPGVNQRSVEHLRLHAGTDPQTLDLPPAQRALVDLLAERGELSLDVARRSLDRTLTTVVDRLERAGIIERVARVRIQPVATATARYLRITGADEPNLDRAPAQKRAWETVKRRLRLSGGEPVAWKQLVRYPGVTPTALMALRDRGAIEILEYPIGPRFSSTSSRSGVSPQLTPEQAAAWGRVLDALRDQESREILLHGVTGSGKTEIYLRAAAWCLSRGRQVIILVPEIALAAQVVGRFTERFPDQVAILHSALSDSERYQTWSAIAGGRIPVVVGPRSALFAPLDRIGLVVIDEEHESSYKQDVVPRYHAREVARQLAHQHGATLLLGSATPDVATFRAAERGEATLLELRERPGSRIIGDGARARHRPLSLPPVEIMDMRLELQRGNTSIFSGELRELLGKTVAAGEQAILFLNRRGSSTFVQCRSCGHVETCPFCDIPLVFHADRGQLVCHRCNHRQPPPAVCPVCASDAIGYYGSGTQRVAREVRSMLPEARVLRWDQDALRRGVGHRDLMRRVLKHEVDVIVGTQMVAKGLDFPLVSLSGVINADTLLHLPDFRAGERTFQLLTQVAGRAGRRAPGGRVIIQSFSPDHYAIQAASRHDFAAFYQEEIAFRHRHGYPPFRRLVRLVYRHPDEVTCQAAAEAAADQLGRTAYRLGLTDVDLLGPSPAFTARIRGRYQWQILVRGSDARRLAAAVELESGWLVDVDPVSLL